MSFGSKEDSENLRSESSFSNTESFHSQYILGKTISHGGSSNVKLAHHRLTGTPVAVKMIPKQENWCHPVTSEVESMMTLNHPNIISLFQVIKTEKRVYLIMELCEGKSLYHHILEAGHLQEDEARAIFRQILHAMNYCHDQGIVHRDLKPDNIMIDSNGKIKVIDFGLSAQVKPGQRLSYHCGTFPFAAPELLLGRLYDGHKLDVWTLGIVLYLMITGRVPFDASNLLHFRRQVVSGKYPVPSRLSRELQDLVRLLLTADPKQRPTIGEVLKHPWVREDSQVFTHPREELPTLGPDVAIIKAMGHLGFREEDIKDSLFRKKYNQDMACYSFLKQQAVKQHECDSLTRSKPMNPLRTPLPSPDDPATFNLEQRCREMQRALHWSSYTSEGHFTPRERRARSQRRGRGGTVVEAAEVASAAVLEREGALAWAAWATGLAAGTAPSRRTASAGLEAGDGPQPANGRRGAGERPPPGPLLPRLRDGWEGQAVLAASAMSPRDQQASARENKETRKGGNGREQNTRVLRANAGSARLTH
ncbi:sperm motility kinase 4A-like [Apodemus sylvaticus]|uniref:sperm motility kinase 4A-like n=1 Tax=Apodemus sylvaticus TaxID=10129 RepID=UPI002243328D|nr:sperm motility kinase 4A-like [Apodemus sylvaticus]